LLFALDEALLLWVTLLDLTSGMSLLWNERHEVGPVNLLLCQLG